MDFTIDINGSTYKVKTCEAIESEDGVSPEEYSVENENGDRIGTVYPELDDAGNLRWESKELRDRVVIKKIGERIEHGDL